MSRQEEENLLRFLIFQSENEISMGKEGQGGRGRAEEAKMPGEGRRRTLEAALSVKGGGFQRFDR